MLEQTSTLAPAKAAGGDIILDVEAACCRFDVSAPALSRLFSHEPRRILRAVENVSFTVRRGTTSRPDTMASVWGRAWCSTNATTTSVPRSARRCPSPNIA